ncbi:hypothetical protein GOP47_0020912 [Adiantum capillus-veneris]|uniref:Uncharacterized protein n=1 Tax=Adiantum capillus-veneris TaxID=13818 RepID=A0A9D4UAV5_ADICA|nr:hypothetical protein GOP47_0020912 [Adiantum capillus-veneris]
MSSLRPVSSPVRNVASPSCIFTINKNTATIYYNASHGVKDFTDNGFSLGGKFDGLVDGSDGAGASGLAVDGRVNASGELVHEGAAGHTSSNGIQLASSRRRPAPPSSPLMLPSCLCRPLLCLWLCIARPRRYATTSAVRVPPAPSSRQTPSASS